MDLNGYAAFLRRPEGFDALVHHLCDAGLGLRRDAPDSCHAADRTDAHTFTQQSEAGRFIDAYERPVPYGRNKLLLAEHFLADHGGSLRESTYYADSITDLPLLEVVGSPKPVNPDLRLQRVAEKRGWPILRFYDVLGPGISSGPP